MQGSGVAAADSNFRCQIFIHELMRERYLESMAIQADQPCSLSAQKRNVKVIKRSKRHNSANVSFHPGREVSWIFDQRERLLLRFQEVQQNRQKTSCLCTFDCTFGQLPTFRMNISWVNNMRNAAIFKHQSVSNLSCD